MKYLCIHNVRSHIIFLKSKSIHKFLNPNKDRRQDGKTERRKDVKT